MEREWHSAVSISMVAGEVDGARLRHVVVWRDLVVLGKEGLVLAQDLAVRQVWVGLGARLWQGSRSVVEIEDVDISCSELSCVDLKITEEAACLIESGDEDRANHAERAGESFAVVPPAILLDHSGDLVDGHVALVSLLNDALNVEARSSKPMVEGLRIF